MLSCFERSGLAEKLGADSIFPEQPVRETSTLAAVRYAYGLVQNPCLTCPRRKEAVRKQGLYYSI
jgi:hypothetical protein